MPRLTLSVGFALAAALPACAQDDYDLARALMDRGWYDLAGDIFTGIQNNASLPAEKRAEGAYGIAQLKMSQAETESDPEKKAGMYDTAITTIKEFISKYPNHPRRNEAYGDIGYLYQQKGKYLMSRAKVDAQASEKAKDAFGEAEKLFSELITNLKGRKPERPEDPIKEKAKMDAYEEWEQQMMLAKYNFGTSLFSHAETYRDKPEKHPDMKRLLEQMVKFFQDDFMWDFENYVTAYDACIYMGRGYQLLAETAEPAKAEDFWKQCFGSIGRARSLTADPKMRPNEGVREVGIRATYYEMKARMAYGDTRRGGAATKQYVEATKLAEDILKYYPNAKSEDMGKIIRLEQGRAYCKAGQLDKGIKILNDLKKQYPDSAIENLAIDVLGEYVGETNVAMAVEAADNYAERGVAFLYGAISKYRRALSAIKKREDEKHLSHCWYQIGYCYFVLDRYWEAVAACTQLEKPQFQRTPDGAKAALLKLQCLAKLKKLTGGKAEEDAYSQFLNWASGIYSSEVGSRGNREAAIELDNAAERAAEAKPSKYKDEYLQAAAKWQAVAKDPNSPMWGEGTFFVGLDNYRHANELLKASKTEAERTKAAPFLNAALDAFKKYLEWYERLPNKEKDAVKYAIGSIHFSVSIYNHERIKKPEEALKISNDLEKRFPTGDPIRLMKIFSLRINSKLELGRVEEAEEDLRSLKARYEKDRLGLESYVTALALLAQEFEKLAAEWQAKDKEKSDAFSIKSGNYYYDVFQLAPEKFKSATLDAVAGKFFMIAEQKYELSQKNNDRKLEDEARRFYDQSRELYSQFQIQPGVKLTDDQRAAIQQRVTRCYLQTGKFEEAVKVYEDITGRDPERKNGSAWEAKADCYMAQAKAMEKSGARVDLIKKADEIYGDLAARLQQLSIRNEHFWRLMYKHADALFEWNYEQLQAFFKVMDTRGYGPGWDDNKWGFQTKFEDLRKKLNEKVGGNK